MYNLKANKRTNSNPKTLISKGGSKGHSTPHLLLASLILIFAAIGTYLILSSHAATTLNADFNSDGSVNITDLSILATNWGSTTATLAKGDANNDNKVTITDLSILAGEWGQTGGQPTVTPVTFAIISDVNNSAVGDTPGPIFTNIINSVKSNISSYVVFPGDALLDKTTDFISRWDLYLTKENPLGLPIYRVPGDNDRVDIAEGLGAWDTKVGMPIYYSKDVGEIHFIFLANAYASHIGWLGYVSENDSSNSQEAKDLVADLQSQAAKAGPKTIIVVQHYPILNGKTDKPYAGTKQSEATALQTLFSKYGVDLVVAADTHVYRSMVVGGVPYLQNLPAASSPRTIGSYPTLPVCQSGEVCDSGYNGYLTITLNSDRSLKIDRYEIVDGSNNRTFKGSVQFSDR